MTFYVHSNLRLIDKISAVDYTETSVQWNNGLWLTKSWKTTTKTRL